MDALASTLQLSSLAGHVASTVCTDITALSVQAADLLQHQPVKSDVSLQLAGSIPLSWFFDADYSGISSSLIASTPSFEHRGTLVRVWCPCHHNQLQHHTAAFPFACSGWWRWARVLSPITEHKTRTSESLTVELLDRPVLPAWYLERGSTCCDEPLKALPHAVAGTEVTASGGGMVVTVARHDACFEFEDPVDFARRITAACKHRLELVEAVVHAAGKAQASLTVEPYTIHPTQVPHSRLTLSTPRAHMCMQSCHLFLCADDCDQAPGDDVTPAGSAWEGC